VSGHPAKAAARAFAGRFGLRVPLLQAPMAGVPSLDLAAAVGDAGAMPALGALLMEPPAIAQWVAQLRARCAAPLQVNLWAPDPPPIRDPAHEARVAAFLEAFGPPAPTGAADARPPDFEAQCAAVLEARPAVFSTIMGLPPESLLVRLKDRGISWFATVTTLAEAREALAAGADALVVQGAEAGGHRGAFEAGRARDEAVGLFALLPRVADAATVPVVATGGIADARGLAAALLLGAHAVQLGSVLLRTPEAGIAPAWARALDALPPEGTRLTRAFSGRTGRAVATRYVEAAAATGAPEPAPYPVQRGLTAAMRREAETAGDLQRMQAWAGQGAGLPARVGPARAWLKDLWTEADRLLPG
jgi:nitronate monooxygenase